MAASRAVASTTLAATVGTTLLLLLLCGGASAQSPSPSSTSNCTAALVSLSPCLSYITGNDSAAAAPPPASCCAQLGKVVASDPQCLCVALSADPASLGLTVNRTRALALPDACKVQTPPVSDCKSQQQGDGPAAGAGGEPGEAAPQPGSKTTPSSTTSFENGAAGAGLSLPWGTAGFVVAAVAMI